MKFLYFFLILIISKTSFCQDKSINQTVNGKKDGIWLVALDSNLCLTKKDTVFLAYQRYDYEFKMISYYRKKEPRKQIYLWQPDTLEQDTINLLSGTMYYMNKDSIIIGVHSFKNGFPQVYEEFIFLTKKSKMIYELLDFTKTYNNIPGTFWYENRQEGESKIYKGYTGWYRKLEKGWVVEKVLN